MFPEGQDSASKHQHASEIMTPEDRLLAQPNYSQGFIHQRVWLKRQLTQWLELGR